MDTLNVNLTYCWGIQSLSHEFDFRAGTNNKARAYAIYAPNGMMKSSFAKTFEALSKPGDSPRDERFGLPSICSVIKDGNSLSPEVIYVLRAEEDKRADSVAITNILINPQYKARYDELIIDINEKKDKLINALQKKTKLSKKDIEEQIKHDCSANTLPECISQLLSEEIEMDLSSFQYSTIFDSKAMEVIENRDFIANANKFTTRYQELFKNAGTIYQKGVFNPTKADTAFDTLKKQGFFTVGHRVHLQGDEKSIDKEELENKLKEVNALIDGDDQLKQIRKNLSKNAQTQALIDLIENLPPTDVGFLLEKLNPENQAKFRKELWTFNVHNCTEATEYLTSFNVSETELSLIERDAAQSAPEWLRIVDLFNNRFVDMPFSLSIANQADAAIGRESAKLSFRFTDGNNTVECLRDDPKMKTLSLGEARAVNLLYFIFEVEDRKRTQQETLFVIDDVADSFDYKNKHAIILYLKDLCKTDFFHQIILSHNFDFYRAISQGFVSRERCLMANKCIGLISLSPAEGINNIFIKKWKGQVFRNDTILYATVPFTRNLIEYAKGEDDPDYLTLTSLLHWKSDTNSITVGSYLDIYNRFFGTTHPNTRNESMVDVLFRKATDICNTTTIEGLNLENKVLMSVAIRIRAEKFITERIRLKKNDPAYWCQDMNQFSNLYEELKALDTNFPERSTLDRVSVTVSSNIHLNSFMYEPILDLSIESLIKLYNEIRVLQP